MRSYILSSLLSVAVALGAVPGHAHAAVEMPRLDIITYSTDSGASLGSGMLLMDGTAISIITGSGNIDIVDADFSLNATFSSPNNSYTGTLNVGSISSGDFMLSAEFSNLALDSITGIFQSDLTYTGGSLAGSLTTGRIEGALFGFTDTVSGFTASNLQASLGAVVPLPAAVWLFGAGLMGLVGVGIRRRQRG